MITPALIDELRCPCCGGPLARTGPCETRDGSLTWGAVRCDCSEYPVLDGILVLTQGPMAGDLRGSVRALAAGNRIQALECAANAATRSSHTAWRRLMARAVRPLLPRLAQRADGMVRGADLYAFTSFEALARRTRTPRFADYLIQRFANPSMMAAVPLLGMLAAWLERRQGGRVVDIGAGAGHASLVLSRMVSRTRIITTDSDFVGLCLARRLLGDRATLIAMDAQKPFPFKDAGFDAVISLDALHYMPCKRAVIGELRRTVHPDGLWVFPHLHDAGGANPTPGIPLPLDGYLRLFDGIGARFFDERDVLAEFARSGGIDLSAPANPGAPVWTMVGGAGAEWARFDDLDLRLAGPLQINPVFARTGATDGNPRYLRAWANDTLRAECAQAERYLPERLEIAASILNDAAKDAGPDMARDDRMRDMIRASILTPAPPQTPVTW